MHTARGGRLPLSEFDFARLLISNAYRTRSPHRRRTRSRLRRTRLHPERPPRRLRPVGEVRPGRRRADRQARRRLPLQPPRHRPRVAADPARGCGRGASSRHRAAPAAYRRGRPAGLGRTGPPACQGHPTPIGRATRPAATRPPEPPRCRRAKARAAALLDALEVGETWDSHDASRAVNSERHWAGLVARATRITRPTAAVGTPDAKHVSDVLAVPSLNRFAPESADYRHAA